MYAYNKETHLPSMTAYVRLPTLKCYRIVQKIFENRKMEYVKKLSDFVFARICTEFCRRNYPGFFSKCAETGLENICEYETRTTREKSVTL